MTDARMPERWLSDRRLLRLSDADHRVFVTALLWSVTNRTDGVIEREDLPLVSGATHRSAAALVAAGLWAARSDGWEITEFATTQTSANELEVLENVRRRDREKKARQRATRGADPDPDPHTANGVPGDVPGDSSPGSSPGTAQAGRKAGRQGKDRPLGEHHSTVRTDVEEVPDDLSTFRRRPAA